VAAHAQSVKITDGTSLKEIALKNTQQKNIQFISGIYEIATGDFLATLLK
jgi:hypothetical protein